MPFASPASALKPLVGAWVTVDWSSGSILTYDSGSLDNGSALQPSGALRLSHTGGPSQLTTGDADPRTGIGWFLPVTLPKDIDFRRYEFWMRGFINMPNGTYGTGATASLVMKASNTPEFDAGFVYSAAARRQEAGDTIENITLAEDNAADPVAGSGDDPYISFNISEGGTATPTRPTSSAQYFSPNNFLLSDQINGSRQVGTKTTDRWDLTSTRIYWVGCWLSTNNAAISAFTVDFEQVQYRFIDRFPEDP